MQYTKTLKEITVSLALKEHVSWLKENYGFLSLGFLPVTKPYACGKAFIVTS